MVRQAVEVACSRVSLKRSKAENRREWPRYRAVKSFSLAARIGGQLLPCTVEDVSLGGARLRFDGAIPSPQVLELSHSEGRAVICTPVWHESDTIGVAFDFSEDSLGLISICIRNMVDLDGKPLAASA